MTTPRPSPKRLEEMRRIAEHVGFEDHLFAEIDALIAEIERHRKAEEKFVDLIVWPFIGDGETIAPPDVLEGRRDYWCTWAGVPEEQK